MPDAQGRATNFDYAAIVRPNSDLPEFAFSPRVGPSLRLPRRLPVRDGDPQPLRVPTLPAIGPRVREPGKADPVWDTAFAIKFTRKAPKEDSEFVQPIGTATPLTRVAELDYFLATDCCAYHASGVIDENDRINAEHSSVVRDLATDYDTFVANGIDAVRIEATTVDNDAADDDANRAARRRTKPTCIRLPDEEVVTPDGRTVTVERYGDANYIANMKRRIAWERWLDQCSSIDRAYFDPKSPKGDIGIAAASRSRDKEFLLALRRLVKTRWLESHESLPDVDDIVQVTVRLNGARILDFIEPDEHARLQAYWAQEDADPGRNDFHADPLPQPLREQYPDTPCGESVRPHSRYLKSSDKAHNGCDVDGWTLYKLDMAVWEHAEVEAGRIGYAGPSGGLGISAKPTDYNHFLREEEVDEFQFS